MSGLALSFFLYGIFWRMSSIGTRRHSSRELIALLTARLGGRLCATGTALQRISEASSSIGALAPASARTTRSLGGLEAIAIHLHVTSMLLDCDNLKFTEVLPPFISPTRTQGQKIHLIFVHIIPHPSYLQNPHIQTPQTSFIRTVRKPQLFKKPSPTSTYCPKILSSRDGPKN